MGQQSQVPALDLMDHLLLLGQAAELLGNVFFAKRCSQTQRVMGGTRHKDLHQFCLNSRETVQHQCLPALTMTARSTAEQGSHRRQEAVRESINRNNSFFLDGWLAAFGISGFWGKQE